MILNAKDFKVVMDELDKVKNPQDLLEIKANGYHFTGILLDKIVNRAILADGTDTTDHPTKLRIRIMENQVIEIANKEITIDIEAIDGIRAIN